VHLTGRYDNDGWLDLFITDFQQASDHVFHNDGKGGFWNGRHQVHIVVPPTTASFGGGFFDYDMTLARLFYRQRHVYPEVENVQASTHFKQINTLSTTTERARSSRQLRWRRWI